MSPTLDAFLRSWPADPWLVATLVLIAAVYLRGWQFLARRDAQRWNARPLAAFLCGLLAIFLALASPIEPFAALLLDVHMVQHLLLMMVAPPLVWLGAPLFPLLRGLPRPIRVFWIIPCFRWSWLRRFLIRLTHPGSALIVFVATSVLWHVPAAYELALGSSAWHYVQHVCFLGSALVFWYPVVRPYPSRPGWSVWLLLPYLLLADLQNTALSALLTFSDRVLYPHYLQVPRVANLSALEDQSIAGVIMWVPGSIAFLVPLFWIGLRLLFGSEAVAAKQPAPIRKRQIALPILDAGVPISPPVSNRSWLTTFLRWRHARLTFQLPLLVLAVALIYDGLHGPAASPLNLAGVLPWIHWRGLIVLALLSVGNVFCLACPFTVPRTLARRWLPAGRSWPRALRGKWLAVVLVGLFLWAYEAFALWDRPEWTAWIALGYFVAAFAIDGFFRGAAFCKYVCPIGQFNFVQSLVSPLEVKVRNHDICTACRTKDCIRGRDGIPGCELQLFLPRKAGNMDCTFCLDCVQACPHTNVALVASLPGSQLWHDRLRSGIGRFSGRRDIAALILVLVFGAFANAAGMVAPVVECERRWQLLLGLSSPLLIITLYYLLAIVVLPLGAVGLAAEVARRWGRLPFSRSRLATRYAYSLVPLGFGMWLAHYSFHLLTSYASIVPVTQRFVNDLGWTGLGEPQWSCACCAPVADWLPRLELLFLDLGYLLSLYTAYRTALAVSSRPRQAVRALLPWLTLLTLLFLTGVWIVFQPMQMRGMLPMGG